MTLLCIASRLLVERQERGSTYRRETSSSSDPLCPTPSSRHRRIASQNEHTIHSESTIKCDPLPLPGQCSWPCSACHAKTGSPPLLVIIVQELGRCTTTRQSSGQAANSSDSVGAHPEHSPRIRLPILAVCRSRLTRLPSTRPCPWSLRADEEDTHDTAIPDAPRSTLTPTLASTTSPCAPSTASSAPSPTASRMHSSVGSASSGGERQSLPLRRWVAGPPWATIQVLF